jgi:hypothetical protein
MLGVLIAVGALVAAALLAARAAGYRIAIVPRSTRLHASSSRQYSLANLLALVTIVCAYLAVAREAAFPQEARLVVALDISVFAAAALLPLGLFTSHLRGGWRWWAPIAIALGAFCSVLGPIGRVAACEAAFLTAAACLLLDCGYCVFRSGAAGTNARCDCANC